MNKLVKNLVILVVCFLVGVAVFTICQPNPQLEFISCEGRLVGEPNTDLGDEVLEAGISARPVSPLAAGKGQRTVNEWK